jgi:uncharacterized protein involved in exopolysaccharide biosynthesis
VDRYDDDMSIAELIHIAREWIRVLWQERRFVAAVVSASAALGLVVAFGSKPEYTASTKILPYRPASAASGLSGLAGLAGVRLPQGAADQTITADLYPEVAKTLDFRAELAEVPLRFSALPEPMTSMQYFREVAKPSVLDVIRHYTVGLPGLILKATRKAEAPQAAPDSGPPIAYYDTEYREVLADLDDRLQASTDKKTFIITITGRMPDRFASADLVRNASDRLMTRIIEYEAKKADEQLRFVEEQASAAKARLDRVQREQAVLADRSRGTMSATAQLEAKRLEREYALAFDLFRQFSADVEQARVRKSQDTPVFTVLERVVVPDRRSSPRRGVILLGALSLGFVVAAAAVAFKRTAQVAP